MKLLAKLSLFAALILSSCTMQSESTPAFADVVINEEVMGKWSRSCALCHVDGIADAPLVGDTAEWQRRLMQGEETVMRNVLEGINSMPPLGYCMSCEVDDFRAMVAFMAGTNR